MNYLSVLKSLKTISLLLYHWKPFIRSYYCKPFIRPHIAFINFWANWIHYFRCLYIFGVCVYTSLLVQTFKPFSFLQELDKLLHGVILSSDFIITYNFAANNTAIYCFFFSCLKIAPVFLCKLFVIESNRVKHTAYIINKYLSNIRQAFRVTDYMKILMIAPTFQIDIGWPLMKLS